MPTEKITVSLIQTMEQWKGKIAVVTGASSGIGAALIEALANAGINVVGLARRVEKVQEIANKLEKTAPGKIYAEKCDVSCYDSIKNAFKIIGERFGTVNILVNNAGVYHPTMILSDEDNVDKFKSMIDTNVLGLVLCTKEAYKLMKSPGNPGYIININSIAGHSTAFAAEYGINIYPGTKHAVTAITDVVRRELTFFKNSDVKITSLSPGLVDTPIHPEAGRDVLLQEPHLTSNDIVQSILYLLSTPKHVDIKELTIKPVGEKVG